MDHRTLTGKTAVVTAGVQGIGRMIATALLEAGATVHITSRSSDSAAAAAEELAAIGPCHALVGPIQGDNACRQLAATFASAEPVGLDILVNNAAAKGSVAMDDTSEESWDEVMDVNVKTPFLLTRAFLPQLRRAGSRDDPARILNIGSISGLMIDGLPSYAYSSSKAALHHLTRMLALELAPDITVNALAPGPFESAGLRAAFERHGDQGKSLPAPLRRIGRPDEVGGAAVFLASPAGAYCTGVILPIDGGIHTTR